MVRVIDPSKGSFMMAEYVCPTDWSQADNIEASDVFWTVWCAEYLSNVALIDKVNWTLWPIFKNYFWIV